MDSNGPFSSFAIDDALPMFMEQPSSNENFIVFLVAERCEYLATPSGSALVDLTGARH